MRAPKHGFGARGVALAIHEEDAVAMQCVGVLRPCGDGAAEGGPIAVAWAGLGADKDVLPQHVAVAITAAKLQMRRLAAFYWPRRHEARGFEQFAQRMKNLRISSVLGMLGNKK